MPQSKHVSLGLSQRAELRRRWWNSFGGAFDRFFGTGWRFVDRFSCCASSRSSLETLLKYFKTYRATGKLDRMRYKCAWMFRSKRWGDASCLSFGTANMQESLTQNELFTACLNPDQPCPAHLKSGKHIPAIIGLKIYRNNIAHGLITTLESNFPKTRTILGSKNFYSLARLYASKEKPSSSLLYK